MMCLTHSLNTSTIPDALLDKLRGDGWFCCDTRPHIPDRLHRVSARDFSAVLCQPFALTRFKSLAGGLCEGAADGPRRGTAAWLARILSYGSRTIWDRHVGHRGKSVPERWPRLP